MSAPLAIVTGAADPGGIGAACARVLARRGHAVGILDRRPADALAGELAAADAVVASGIVDLADHAAIPTAVDALEAELGDTTSVLVDCAADLTMRSLADTDAASMQRVLAVNVVAVAMLARRVAPGMARRGFGRIVNIASDTFDRPPGPGFVAYVTAKGALVGLTRSVAVELGPWGITVNAIAPGLTRTPSVQPQQPETVCTQVQSAQAIRRPLEPSTTRACSRCWWRRKASPSPGRRFASTPAW